MKSFSWLLLAAPAAAQYPLLNDSAWAGPVMQRDSKTTSSPANFTSVSATFIAPTVRIPQRPKEVVDEYAAAFWIGLEGMPEIGAPRYRGLWQAGVIASAYANGTTYYKGFYEWVPEDAIWLSPQELTVNEGDHIAIDVSTADRGYNGTITMTNLNTTQVWTITRASPVTPRGPTWHAPGLSAEWIAEAGTDLKYVKYILPDFGNATFLDAKACRTDGVCLGPEGQNTTVVQLVDDKLYSKSYVGKDVIVEYIEVDL